MAVEYFRSYFLEMLWMGEIKEYVVFVLPEARTKIINWAHHENNVLEMFVFMTLHI